jgi:hypothetical protein
MTCTNEKKHYLGGKRTSLAFDVRHSRLVFIFYSFSFCAPAPSEWHTGRLDGEDLSIDTVSTEAKIFAIFIYSLKSD